MKKVQYLKIMAAAILGSCLTAIIILMSRPEAYLLAA